MADLPKWYSTGTVSIANGSPTLTGVGTAWNNIIRAGDVFRRAGLAVRVLSVDSDTSITLAENWPGTTLSGSAYEIAITYDGPEFQLRTRELLEQFADGVVRTVTEGEGIVVDLADPQNPIVSTAMSAFSGMLYGLTLSNNATDATNDIDIAAGTAIDSANAAFMTLASGITKRLDASWAVGSGNGGLDTGTIADTTYHVWLIKRTDTGVVDVLFSTSASSPTMPANYTLKRRIGSIIRASSAIVLFTQVGDKFFRKVRSADLTTSSARSNAFLTLGVPTGIVLFPILTGRVVMSTAGDVAMIAQDNTTVSGVHVIARGAVAGESDVNTIDFIPSNTSAQIALEIGVNSGTLSLATVITHGWIDPRGRV